MNKQLRLVAAQPFDSVHLMKNSEINILNIFESMLMKNDSFIRVYEDKLMFDLLVVNEPLDTVSDMYTEWNSGNFSRICTVVYNLSVADSVIVIDNITHISNIHVVGNIDTKYKAWLDKDTSYRILTFVGAIFDCTNNQSMIDYIKNKYIVKDGAIVEK